MRIKQVKKLLSLSFCMMLIVATALFTGGCNNKKSVNEVTLEESNISSDIDKTNITVLGEGENQFLFTVVDKEGEETVFEIHTDHQAVGDALMELNLIEGEVSEYGLYVKKVNNIAADYDTDGTYWAFYVNGEYALTGVDSTNIEEGSSYAFKVEK